MGYLSPLKSNLKIDVILNLLEKDKKLSELKKETHACGTTILHALKELEKLELTTKTDGIYKLTPLGVFEAHINRGYRRSFAVLKKYKDFWLTHNISVIPPTLMRNIGALENSNLIKSTHVDLQKVHENFIQLLCSAKNVLGVSPIFHQDYIEAFREILNQPESKISLIVTSAVLEKIKQINDTQMSKHISEGNLQIFLNDNLKIALTVTEKNWSIGLFTLSGEYDYTNDLVGSGEEGVEWSQQLFKKILEQSTET